MVLFMSLIIFLVTLIYFFKMVSNNDDLQKIKVVKQQIAKIMNLPLQNILRYLFYKMNHQVITQTHLHTRSFIVTYSTTRSVRLRFASN